MISSIPNLVIQILIGLLRTILKGLDMWLEDLEIGGGAETIKITYFKYTP